MQRLSGDRSAGVITATLGILLLLTAGSCSLFGPKEGTLRLDFTDLEGIIGADLYYRVATADSLDQACGSEGVLCSSFTISRGTHSVVISDIARNATADETSPRSFSGGTRLYITSWIDMDSSGGVPLGGLDYEITGTREVVIDDDTTLTVTYPVDYRLSDNGYVEAALYLDDVQTIGNLGTAYAGITFNYTIMVRNRGTAVMLLDETEPITLSGLNSPLFSISADLEDFSLRPGEQAPFTLSFHSDPAGDYPTGLKSIVFRLHYRDPLDVPFQMTLTVDVGEPVISLPRTGQSISYAPGDDGDLERGVAWPDPRFHSNGDGTVSDLLTGLMWQATPPEPYYSGYTWDWAVDTYVNTTNSAALGGHSDWHLPNVNEMYSLVNASYANSAAWLNGIDGFSGISGDKYWLSTRSFYQDYYYPMGYFMEFGDRTMGRTNISALPYCLAWLVRQEGDGTVEVPKTGKTANYRPYDDGSLELGAAWPSPRFVILEDVVFDALTGLMWKQAPSSSAMNWESALAYANDLDAAGYDDWRIPNLFEMRSLINYGVASNDDWLAMQFGTDVTDLRFWWTSTTAVTDYGSTMAYVVYMNTGTCGPKPKSDLNYCWVVRDVY